MRWLAFAFVLGCGSPQHGTESNVTVMFDGDITTMDPAHPHATAIAWDAHGVITAVGGDELATGAATKIDLHGKAVTPGLIDAHCHLSELGGALETVSVKDAPDEAAAATLVGASAPSDGWLFGFGWDQNKWPGQAFPSAASLDAVTALPAIVDRVDGHAVWVNTRALARAGITAKTPDPQGGKIVHDASGKPTGVLIDTAIGLVTPPHASAATITRQIKAAAQVAIAKGITGVHEMGIADVTQDVYRELARANQLPLHVYAFARGDADHPLATSPQPATGNFIVRGVKFFADGALGSRGARLKAPYTDDPQSSGLWRMPPEKLNAAVDAAVAHGWDVAIHAIGDAAVAAVIDAFLAARKAHPAVDVNLRVEHTQILAPEDVPRMVEARAIASMQPTHATSDMPWAEARLGPDRIKAAYAWRTVLDHHIPLIGGSDFPVEEVGPILGIYAAVTRQDAAGKPDGGWYPAQRMTLDEAIAAFTRDAAAAQHVTDRGVLKVGNRADITVYSGKLVPDRSLLSLTIARTIVDGVVVYEGTAP